MIACCATSSGSFVIGIVAGGGYIASIAISRLNVEGGVKLVAAQASLVATRPMILFVSEVVITHVIILSEGGG